MKDENFISLCTVIDNEFYIDCDFGRNYFYEDQQRQCGEIRCRENNRTQNLRNYEERPEDYRER